MWREVNFLHRQASENLGKSEIALTSKLPHLTAVGGRPQLYRVEDAKAVAFQKLGHTVL